MRKFGQTPLIYRGRSYDGQDPQGVGRQEAELCSLCSCGGKGAATAQQTQREGGPFGWMWAFWVSE